MVLSYTFNITQDAGTTKYITEGINKMFQLLRIMEIKFCQVNYKDSLKGFACDYFSGVLRFQALRDAKHLDGTEAPQLVLNALFCLAVYNIFL